MIFLITIVFTHRTPIGVNQNIWASSIEVNVDIPCDDHDEFARLMSNNIGSLFERGVKDTRKRLCLGDNEFIEITSHNVVRII